MTLVTFFPLAGQCIYGLSLLQPLVATTVKVATKLVAKLRKFRQKPACILNSLCFHLFIRLVSALRSACFRDCQWHRQRFDYLSTHAPCGKPSLCSFCLNLPVAGQGVPVERLFQASLTIPPLSRSLLSTIHDCLTELRCSIF